MSVPSPSLPTVLGLGAGRRIRGCQDDGTSSRIVLHHLLHLCPLEVSTSELTFTQQERSLHHRKYSKNTWRSGVHGQVERENRTMKQNAYLKTILFIQERIN